MPFVLTANRLDTGDVVYRDGDGAWRPDFADAAVYGDAAEIAAARAATAGADVVEIDEIEVTIEDGAARPLRLRERIRAFGPTVPFGTDAIRR